MHENEIAKIVFDTVVKIHKKLGPGLFTYSGAYPPTFE